MFQIYGLEATPAKLIAATATASDYETAELIAESYNARGLVARICPADYDGRRQPIILELAA